MRMTRRKRRAYYRLRRGTTINGRAESDACDIENVDRDKGQQAVDPRPSQPCFGGLGMSDPHVEPGETCDP